MNRCFYIAFVVFSILLSKNSHAQNLVPNPGFELISTCNVSSLQQGLNAVDDWESFDYSQNSPDIFNSCFTLSIIQLPNSTFGYTYANSGEGIAGIAAIPAQNDYREIISNELNEALVKDSAYCISFYVKNARTEDYIFYSNNLGLLFSQNQIDQNQIHQEASILPVNAVKQNNWVEISGYYIASGGEQFVHIGYFGLNHSYYTEPNSSGLIYYYIDDVSVVPCNKDSLLDVTLELPNVFTPNGDGDNDLYSIKQQNIKTLEVVVFNRWGEQITQYDGKTTQWNGKDAAGEEVSDGVYFVKAVAETTFGETLQKQQVVHVFTKYVP